MGPATSEALSLPNSACAARPPSCSQSTASAAPARAGRAELGEQAVFAAPPYRHVTDARRAIIPPLMQALLVWLERTLTRVSENSRAVPGPRLVMKGPSTTTRASTSLHRGACTVNRNKSCGSNSISYRSMSFWLGVTCGSYMRNQLLHVRIVTAAVHARQASRHRRSGSRTSGRIAVLRRQGGQWRGGH